MTNDPGPEANAPSPPPADGAGPRVVGSYDGVPVIAPPPAGAGTLTGPPRTKTLLILLGGVVAVIVLAILGFLVGHFFFRREPAHERPPSHEHEHGKHRGH